MSLTPSPPLFVRENHLIKNPPLKSKGFLEKGIGFYMIFSFNSL